MYLTLRFALAEAGRAAALLFDNVFGLSQAMMRTCRRWLFLVALLVPSAAFAQTANEAYLPLQIGNRWSFYTVLFPPPTFEPDTTFFPPLQIEDTLHAGGHIYFRYADGFQERFLRVDEEGRVRWLFEGRETVWIDTTVPPGETYIFMQDSTDFVFTVTIEQRTVETAGGRFVDALSFSFNDPNWIDEEYSYTLVRGVGVVSYWCCMGGIYRELSEAVIDGHVVTAREETAEVPDAPLLRSVYPHPFSEHLTVALVLPPSDGSETKVAVFDVLGRRIRVLAQGRLAPGPLYLTWDGQDDAGRRVASGLYVVRLQHGGVMQARPVVRAW